MLHPDRNGRLTASWHPEALGLGYLSPKVAWDRFHGLWEPDETTKGFMEWGHEHEKDAIAVVEAVSGEIIDRTGDDQLWTPYEDWSGCTTDGLIENGIVEAKCPRTVPSEPKKAWLAQVQSQLHITGRSIAYLCAWSPDASAVWLVTRCDQYWPSVEPMLKQYWEMLKGGRPTGRQKKPKLDLDFKWEAL